MLTEISMLIHQTVHNNATHFTVYTHEQPFQFRSPVQDTGYLGHHDRVDLPGKQKTTIKLRRSPVSHRRTTSGLWVPEEPGVTKLWTKKITARVKSAEVIFTGPSVQRAAPLLPVNLANPPMVSGSGSLFR